MTENTLQTTPTNETQVQVHGGETKVPTTREETRYIIPPVDIYETEQGLTVVVDLPGVEKDNVDVRLDNGLLTIQGTVRREATGPGIYNEFALLDYFRQFQVSDRIDQTQITAGLKNGVLHVELPKAEKARPRSIEVKFE